MWSFYRKILYYSPFPLVGLFLLVITFASPALAASTLTIAPSAPGGAQGTIISVNIAAEGLQDLYAAEFVLEYDPTVLQAVNAAGSAIAKVTAGDVFRGSYFTARNMIGSSSGTVEFAATYLGEHAGYSGNGTFFSLNFKVLAEQETKLLFKKAKLVKNDHSVPEVVFENLVLNAGVQKEQVTGDGGADADGDGPASSQNPQNNNLSGQPLTDQSPAGASPSSSSTSSAASGDALSSRLLETVELVDKGRQRKVITMSTTELAGAIPALLQSGKKMLELQLTATDAAVQVADVLEVDIPLQALSMLQEQELGLQLQAGRAVLNLPAEQLRTVASDGRDLYLEITELKQSEELEQLAQQLRSVIPESRLQGDPLQIKTNFKGRTRVSLRFAGVPLPADEKERETYMNFLAVYISRENGEERILRGESIRAAGEGTIDATFWLDSFSTFALIELPEGEEQMLSRNITLQVGSQEALVDGRLEELDAVPFIASQAGRTLVPVRFVSEVLGAGVLWIPETRRVQIKDEGAEILLTIDSDVVSLDGQPAALDCPAVIVENRTFVPLRFIGENLGASVEWDEASQTIIILR